MGLKEPVILNDMVGWKLRGAQPHQLTPVLTDVLDQLSRPFSQGEAVIAKPSSLINSLAPQILETRPESKALFLHAPLKDYLGSIARKGMWGRLWVRDLMVKQRRERMINLGFQDDDYLGLTDIQAAAVGWLAQHALFADLARHFGKDRIVTLDSVTLMASPSIVMAQLFEHFDLPLDQDDLDALVNGPVFNRHAKTGTAFDGASREADRSQGAELYADEIEKVAIWAEAVAQNAGVPLQLPARVKT